MGPATPTVDVVIPVFNGESTVRRAVESVLDQTYSTLRVIVVDDGSADRTVDVLAEIHDPRLTVLLREHLGVSASRNAGIVAGTSDFLAFLDADDYAERRWLEAVMALSGGAALVGCGGRIVQAGSPDRFKLPTVGVDGVPRLVFLAGLFLVRRDLILDVGGYTDDLARSENSDLGFRLMRHIAEQKLVVRATEEPLVTICRPRDQAAKYSPHVRRASAEVILAKNPDWPQHRPRLAGTYHAIAGYSALRVQDVEGARTHLWGAVRLHPAKVKYWILLARALMSRHRENVPHRVSERGS